MVFPFELFLCNDTGNEFEKLMQFNILFFSFYFIILSFYIIFVKKKRLVLWLFLIFFLLVYPGLIP
jgi:hypothetical protein